MPADFSKFTAMEDFQFSIMSYSKPWDANGIEFGPVNVQGVTSILIQIVLQS